MEVALAGIVTLVRLLHQPNASFPMEVTPSEMVTPVRLVQEAKALSPPHAGCTKRNNSF